MSRLSALRGRYQLKRELSRHRESCVYAAEDRLLGERCAAKIFRCTDSASYERARKEYETLRRVQHPGVAHVYDFGRLDSDDARDTGPLFAPQEGSAEPRTEACAYLITQFYDGLNLRNAFLRLGNSAEHNGEHPSHLDDAAWEVFLRSVADLSHALHAIHQAGLIHYDIKPDNLILAGESPKFQPKIIDFGLSSETTTPLGDRVPGTVPFIAPEVLLRRNPDPRSDLYSLGVSIAFAVSGRYPYSGPNEEEWLKAAMSGDVLSLDELCPEAPGVLTEVVSDLLAPDPLLRPKNALAVARRLTAQSDSPWTPPAAAASRRAPAVGWESQLGKVRVEIEQLRRDEHESGLILVEGGHDQFADEFMDAVETLARGEGVTVFRAWCHLPRRFAYQPFAELARQLQFDVELNAPRFAHFAEAVARITPVATAPAPLPQLPQETDSVRFLALLTDFFLAVSADRPVIFCIRDLESAGAESLDLLTSILRNLKPAVAPEAGLSGQLQRPPARLMIVATFADEDSERDGDPRIATAAQRVRKLADEPRARLLALEDLTLEQTDEWLRTRSPQIRLPAESLRRIHEVTMGAPRRLDAALRRLEASASECSSSADRGREADDPAALHRHVLSLPPTSSASLQARATDLPPAAAALLELLLVARGAAPFAMLSMAQQGGSTKSDGQGAASDTSVANAERGAPDVSLDEHAVAALVETGFVRVWDGIEGKELHLTSREYRYQEYRRIPFERRTELHRSLAKAARTLSASCRCRISEDAIYHARLGACPVLFYDQSLRGVERLAKVHATNAAIDLAEAALGELSVVVGQVDATSGMSLADGDDHDRSDQSFPAGHTSHARTVLNELLATLYSAHGNGTKSLEKLTVLSSLFDASTNPEGLASVYRRIGELYLEGSDHTNGLFFLERALLILRGPDGESSTQTKFRIRDEKMKTLLLMARHLLKREETGRAVDVLEQCLRLSDDATQTHRNTVERCRALLLLAGVAHSGAERERAKALRSSAAAVASASHLPWLRMEVLGVLGAHAKDVGEFDAAIALLEERIAIAAECHSKLDLASSHTTLGTAYYGKGNRRQALDCYFQALQLSHETGDTKGLADSYINLGNVHRLTDDLTQARGCYTEAISLYSRVNDQLGMARGMSNLASILELEGKYNEGIDYAYRALQKRKKNGVVTDIAFSYYRLGHLYQSKGELSKALNYAERSFRMRQQANERLGLANSQLQLAQIHLAQSKLTAALKYCYRTYREFQSLKNEVGALFARDVFARVLLEIGRHESARRITLKVLEKARRLQQPVLVASCLMQLARISSYLGDEFRAERELSEAETLFRSAANQRELATVLLAQAHLQFDCGHTKKAERLASEAYEILERLGIRDLVPRYFLLRGRIELRRSGRRDPVEAEKLLTRGLLEARESNLPDLVWRFHFFFGDLEAVNGHIARARLQYEKAASVLDDIATGLPPSGARSFRQERHRHAVWERLDSLETHDDPAAEQSIDSESEGTSQGAADFLEIHREILKLHEVAGLLGDESDLEKLLEQILDAVLELVDAERGFILWHHGTAATDYVVARSVRGREIDNPRALVSRSVASQVLESGAPLVVRDAIVDEGLKSSESIRNLHIRSLICLPLRFRKKVIGVIHLDNTSRKDAFLESDARLLQAFADQAAVAIQTALLFGENKRQTAALRAANAELDRLNLKLQQKVHRQSTQLAIAEENLRDQQLKLEERYRFDTIVGRSRPMQLLYHLLERISPTDLSVLIEGESGTGKELIARAIHYNSHRKSGRFVSVNCAALSDDLLETELFGHVRGAFTGALSNRRGLFDEAHNGSLFLDSVGDMSPQLQNKLLRVLQEGEFRRVGAKEVTQVNVRIISASDSELDQAVNSGAFRKDLYFRLNGVLIPVPPLRDRAEDIPLLVEHFCNEARGDNSIKFTRGAIQQLMGYSWPGNVRELKTTVEKAAVMRDGEPVRAQDLGLAAGQQVDLPKLREARDRFERDYLLACLGQNQSVSKAAQRCGISRETFYRLMRKHGLTTEPRGGSSPLS